ncbi:hypothetical protein RWZ02_15745 [Clostridium butyricum]|nr:hypothetical protein [Clostridium butyricum]MDU0324127.1 hypothetical protein [Clostridium butyricum]
MKNKKIVAIYCRISTIDEEQECCTIDEQQKLLNKYTDSITFRKE